MKVLLQRVTRASVCVGKHVIGEIDAGLVALIGVGTQSTDADALWLAGKTQSLRIFPDEMGRMDRSVESVGGSILAISQFTLYSDTPKGRRPSFAHAADPPKGQALYQLYCDTLTVPVAHGRFGAHMTIEMAADGPVTIALRCEQGRPI